MGKIMSEIKIETWELGEISEAISKTEYKQKRIVIPLFQRGKRWSEEKEGNFITSLRKNYPIGTLLFFRTIINNTETYTLIDGLQRSNTIKKFFDHPTKFFKISEFSNDYLPKIISLLDLKGSQDKIGEQINHLVINYFNDIKKIDQIELFNLIEKFVEVFPSLQTKRKELAGILKPFLVSFEDNFKKLSKSRIPAIVYSGDEETLPEIFALINSQGVPLTNYEIYAASWPKDRFFVENSLIVEKVLKKYDSLNDNEFELAGYNRNEIRTQKKLTPFEYVFGLSKFIDEKFNIFTFGKKEEDDEVSTTAFVLLNACFYDDYGSIKDIHKVINKFKEKNKELEDKLLGSIEFVAKLINQIIQFKGNNRNAKSYNFHTFFQVISLVSFVFRTHFDIETLKSKDQTWTKDKQTLKENIWKYYVYDIIANTWSDGGTTKTHAFNKENRYLRSIEKSQFSATIDGYFQDSLSRRESFKVGSMKPQDYVILNTIYQDLFSARQQLDINQYYDVEHLAPKNLLKSIMGKINTPSDEGLPISSIANLCYLPEYINRSKGDDTIYQDINYFKKSNLSLVEIESKYTFTNKENLDFLYKTFQDGDFYDLKNEYITFLNIRFAIMKEKFISSLFR